MSTRQGRKGGAKSARVAVGYVVRAKGIKGEVKVEPLTHSPERFGELSEVVLERPGHPDQRLRLERWRVDMPGVLLKFAGVDTPEDARELLVKGYLTVPRDEVAPLPSEDEFYVFDAVGCRVEDESGAELGEVIDVLAMPSADIFLVVDGGREIMIPAVADFIVELSLGERRLVVRGVAELLQ